MTDECWHDMQVKNEGKWRANWYKQEHPSRSSTPSGLRRSQAAVVKPASFVRPPSSPAMGRKQKNEFFLASKAQHAGYFDSSMLHSGENRRAVTTLSTSSSSFNSSLGQTIFDLSSSSLRSSMGGTPSHGLGMTGTAKRGMEEQWWRWDGLRNRTLA
eukprot:TRINITY_DN86771_c0_g1_i1.p1 TRINITY_DN86771_c0_g1~~TRINITY_DN86771_c0_g1_i1.p1  ORF type:complete len:157 (-),score=26.23 TRINITY_DN86771_c0_g1_i1:340-810(-)